VFVLQPFLARGIEGSVICQIVVSLSRGGLKSKEWLGDLSEDFDIWLGGVASLFVGLDHSVDYRDFFVVHLEHDYFSSPDGSVSHP